MVGLGDLWGEDCLGDFEARSLPGKPAAGCFGVDIKGNEASVDESIKRWARLLLVASFLCSEIEQAGSPLGVGGRM